jgi:hypothetical protein
MSRKQISRAFPLLVSAALAGCGGGEAAVTDVSKVTPLTDEQVKAFRAVDDAVAAEENANPTPPKRGGAAR